MGLARDEMNRQIVIVKADVRVGFMNGRAIRLGQTEAAGRRRADEKAECKERGRTPRGGARHARSVSKACTAVWAEERATFCIRDARAVLALGNP